MQSWTSLTWSDPGFSWLYGLQQANGQHWRAKVLLGFPSSMVEFATVFRGRGAYHDTLGHLLQFGYGDFWRFTFVLLGDAWVVEHGLVRAAVLSGHVRARGRKLVSTSRPVLRNSTAEPRPFRACIRTPLRYINHIGMADQRADQEGADERSSR